MRKIQNVKSKRLTPMLQVCKIQNRIIKCDVVYDSRCDKSRKRNGTYEKGVYQ